MITGFIISRARVILGSGITLVASDIAGAKLAILLANAKMASMQATQAVAVKLVAKATAFWVFFVSCFAPMPSTLPTPRPPLIYSHKVAKVPSRIEAVPIAVPEKMPLNLHSFERDYTLQFSGKISCGGAACRTGSIELHISSKKNPDITRTLPIEPDGSYNLLLPVKEDLHEHIDWWITAESPDSASKQIQGREILADDPLVSIEQSISLL